MLEHNITPRGTESVLQVEKGGKGTPEAAAAWSVAGKLTAAQYGLVIPGPICAGKVRENTKTGRDLEHVLSGSGAHTQ